ncbi:glycerate kinase [Herbaspirillum sp. AP02]|uniref:glycerate kinase n=1 Tax=unclassified Herbaspirillum TaxID=2624150 RepID=UPI0015D9D527|nr:MULTISPECIES: glycerate kinase [unclassified Herbaspirillum]MBG7618457.1 glycerate kinase [Herbaspirillum sp. AP02]NZD68617.1 glycerate kinase [Herbaspirillum sp. AP21]
MTPTRSSLPQPVVVIAPDSFKGSLSAEEVAAAIGAGVKAAIPEAEIRLCPIADGGEGTLDALMHAGGERFSVNCRNAAGQAVTAPVGILRDGSAVVESAAIVGLTDPAGTSLPVELRTTLGVGDAIKSLLDRGARRFLVALGGSSTNDGGAGLLAALGAVLRDATGETVPPQPAQLHRVVSIDVSALDPRISEAHFVAMSDVDNPLCGEEGATAVFGPQKGVQADQVEQLDHALHHFAGILEQALGRHAINQPGAGAAGGLGYALLMLGAQFRSGAETVADHIGLDEALAGADWLITGEGRSDAQTLHGKAPFIASQRARRVGVPTTLLSGGIDRTSLEKLQTGFSGCFSISFGPMSLPDAIAQAPGLLHDSGEQLARLWQAARSR